MLSIRYTIITVLFLILCQSIIPAYGQLGVSFDLKKPKEYEERVLRSERSDQKKFKVPRRFMQNTVTHYNYFFNANVKLNEVIERAKLAFKDDYSQLLPFYNYSLDVTAADTIQIDSVSYKAQSGIALHDLRNDWIDNLYLLWGASYYLRKDFDSAYLMFQFINYSYAEKQKDGYYKTIGSKIDGNSATSIATREKNSLPRRMLSQPPSRNDAFIWQIRNFLAQEEYPEAASMIITLKDDPAFPERLQDDLEEVQALWFYKQEMWDSAAAHLVNALSNAENLQEKARWEFLLGQLYEMTGKFAESEKYFGKAIVHTTDPILDIYGRLYSIRVNKDGGENYIEKNIEQLLKMARRDKYEEFRDIIYYMAAQMELERDNFDGALALLLKSTQYATNNPTQRNKAFLQLAELTFGKKLYRLSYNFHDSLRMDDPQIKNPEALLARKESLGKIAVNLDIVTRQDSLQRIASLPENERTDLLKKMARQLRKQQGLKEEPLNLGSGSAGFQNAAPPALFSNNETRGEWYFYNTTSRNRGAADFKTKWGNRPNADNWRRSSSLAVAMQTPAANNMNTPMLGKDGLAAPLEGEITYESLEAKLPLTIESMKVSNDSIKNALYQLGKVYINGIEDCESGTFTLEQLRTQYPDFNPMDDVLFSLYYCYQKNGNTVSAQAIKQLMNEKYSESNFTKIVTTGKNPQVASSNSEATATYEKIYDLFIEGSFTEAVAQKKVADSMYSNNFWTPQLLYIEAVYYIKERNDSTAINVLNGIITKFPQTGLAGKAKNLISVLGRRKQIEDELTKLELNMPPPDTTTRVTVKPAERFLLPKDSTIPKPLVVTPPVVTTPPVVKQPLITDSTKSTAPPVVTKAPFVFAANAPHYVVLILNKVDPVFVNEAKNAFFRYNRETYYNKQYTVDLLPIDTENRLMLISPFANAQEATVYVDQTKPKTATEIIPWLKGGKFSFIIIDEKNLELLKGNLDIDGYRNFLEKQMPGKF